MRMMQRKSGRIRRVSPEGFRLSAVGRLRGALWGWGVLLLAAAAGCPSKPTSTPKEHEGLVVTIACPEGPAASLVARYGKVWSVRTGARLEVVSFDARS